jgi:hypothetical protein
MDKKKICKSCLNEVNIEYFQFMTAKSKVRTFQNCEDCRKSQRLSYIRLKNHEYKYNYLKYNPDHLKCPGCCRVTSPELFISETSGKILKYCRKCIKYISDYGNNRVSICSVCNKTKKYYRFQRKDEEKKDICLMCINKLEKGKIIGEPSNNIQSCGVCRKYKNKLEYDIKKLGSTELKKTCRICCDKNKFYRNLRRA